MILNFIRLHIFRFYICLILHLNYAIVYYYILCAVLIFLLGFVKDAWSRIKMLKHAMSSLSIFLNQNLIFNIKTITSRRFNKI